MNTSGKARSKRHLSFWLSLSGFLFLAALQLRWAQLFLPQAAWRRILDRPEWMLHWNVNRRNFAFNHPLFLRKGTKNSKGDGEVDNDWIPNVIFGNYSMPITFDGPPDGDSQAVQKIFDVGLMECYGFAFFEARKMATKLLDLENSGQSTPFYCPMCHWLLAMGHSPYINHPIIAAEDDFRAAAKAAENAYRKAHDAPPDSSGLSTKELGLIDAMHVRFAPPSVFENQTIGYERYKARLQDLHETLQKSGGSGDPDVMAFLADSIMVLHSGPDGYEFYDPETSEPNPEIAHATTLLEGCLEVSRDHPLCQHLYIHVTEPSDRRVGRSEPVATHLAAVSRGSDAQHLQHMPAHAFVRTGRYHAAVVAGVASHASDRVYQAHGGVAYGPGHDLVVLVYAAGLSGEEGLAQVYSDALREHYRRYPNKPDGPGTNAGWHVWRTIRLRFGAFRAILEDTDAIPTSEGGEEEPTGSHLYWPYAELLGHYCKGVASLWVKGISDASDRLADAKAHQRKLREIIPSVDPSYSGMAFVANQTLEAAVQYYEIRASGHTEETKALEPVLSLLRSASIEQEHWTYTEPPPWYSSLRLCVGTLLRIMGRYQDSVAAFDNDLKGLPENRYALYGLWRVLKEAGASEGKLRAVWERYERASIWADEGLRERPPLVCPELGE